MTERGAHLKNTFATTLRAKAVLSVDRPLWRNPSSKPNLYVFSQKEKHGNSRRDHRTTLRKKLPGWSFSNKNRSPVGIRSALGVRSCDLHLQGWRGFPFDGHGDLRGDRKLLSCQAKSHKPRVFLRLKHEKTKVFRVVFP